MTETNQAPLVAAAPLVSAPADETPIWLADPTEPEGCVSRAWFPTGRLLHCLQKGLVFPVEAGGLPEADGGRLGATTAAAAMLAALTAQG